MFLLFFFLGDHKVGFWRYINDIVTVRKHVDTLTFYNPGKMMQWPTARPAVCVSLSEKEVVPKYVLLFFRCLSKYI